MKKISWAPPSRRNLLLGASVAIAAPHLWIRSAAAAERVMVRTPGGTYDERRLKTVYEPFRAETGIEVVPVASSAGKLVAMFKAGRPDMDVIETGDDILWLLEDAGALLEMPYGEFKFTDPNDLEPGLKRKFHAGMSPYSDVLGFNTTAYAPGKEPKSWAEFWDAKAFPGPRGLADMQSGVPNLEFALLADGVPADKIYPIDVERAFKSLSRIRPSVVKFWDSGALSAQMLADKETVLSSIWSSRAQAALDKGAPVAIQWSQNLVNLTATAITNNASNMKAAKLFVDYTLSAPVQARWLSAAKDIPANKKAYGSIAKELIDPATNLPWTASKGFIKNARWWADNRQMVSDAWSKWVIQ